MQEINKNCINLTKSLFDDQNSDIYDIIWGKLDNLHLNICTRMGKHEISHDNAETEEFDRTSLTIIVSKQD